MVFVMMAPLRCFVLTGLRPIVRQRFNPGFTFGQLFCGSYAQCLPKNGANLRRSEPLILPSPFRSQRALYGALGATLPSTGAKVSRSEPFAAWLSSKSTGHRSGGPSLFLMLSAAHACVGSVPMNVSEAKALGGPMETLSGKPSQSLSPPGQPQPPSQHVCVASTLPFTSTARKVKLAGVVTITGALYVT